MSEKIKRWSDLVKQERKRVMKALSKDKSILVLDEETKEDEKEVKKEAKKEAKPKRVRNKPKNSDKK